MTTYFNRQLLRGIIVRAIISWLIVQTLPWVLAGLLMVVGGPVCHMRMNLPNRIARLKANHRAPNQEAGR